MTTLQLHKCHYFGPYFDDKPDRVSLPPDAADDPFRYVPDAITLTPEELDLATRYENNDISGGYLTSQIAHFRKPQSAERHAERRRRFGNLQLSARAGGFRLPQSFVKLAESDDYNNRIRHNSIWLSITDRLVALPAAPDHQLATIFYEGQGCAYWHLLLAPDGSHLVALSGEPLGSDGDYPGDFQPDLSSFKFYQCAASFDEWLAYYFLDCIATDKHYTAMLARNPGL
jgi:hypothetical protein